MYDLQDIAKFEADALELGLEFARSKAAAREEQASAFQVQVRLVLSSYRISGKLFNHRWCCRFDSWSTQSACGRTVQGMTWRTLRRR